MINAIANLPLPDIPAEMQQIIIKEHYKNLDNAFNPRRYHTSGDGIFRIWPCPDNIVNWVNQNICINTSIKYIVGIQTISGGSFDPHIDPISEEISRNWTLMYIIKSGGDPYTRIYTPIDLIKDERLIDPSTIKEIDKFQFKENTWNILYNRCIHSVDYMNSDRICLSISFSDVELPAFIQELL